MFWIPTRDSDTETRVTASDKLHYLITLGVARRRLDPTAAPPEDPEIHHALFDRLAKIVELRAGDRGDD